MRLTLANKYILILVGPSMELGCDLRLFMLQISFGATPRLCNKDRNAVCSLI